MAKWEQLIAARERKHLSQLEAAERVNVGAVTYQRWEAGKTKPQPQHMRHLSEVFETLFEQHAETPSQQMCSDCSLSTPLPEDLRKETPVVLSGEETDKPQAFITTHMPSHLWFLALLNHPTCYDKRSAIRQSIKEFDSMNTDNKNYQITRREALCSLATLPMMTLGLTAPEKVIPSSHYGNALAQCAASVEACYELSRHGDASDRVLAYQCATRYLPALKTIAQNSSQHRVNALDLATRYSWIKAFVARHYTGHSEAIQYGINAVALSKETGNTSLQLHAFSSLGWSYLFAGNYRLALATMQEAEALLQQHTQLPNAQLLHPQVGGGIYATLAIMQARNGKSADRALGKATEIDPGDESSTPLDFKRSTLILDAGWTYYYQGDQAKAMEWLSKPTDCAMRLHS